MEIVFLRRLVEELQSELLGRRIDQVYAIPPHHLALVIGARGAPRLWFAAEPDEPHLYLRGGAHPTPGRPPAFAMAVRKWARGRRIESLRLIGEDRVVQLRWSGTGARLIFEVIPRRATALILDPDDRVVASWNPRRGRPTVGARYEPPTRPPRKPVEQLDATDWRDIATAASDRAVARAMMRTVAGVSALVADEAVTTWHRGEKLESALRDALEASRRQPDQPCIYAAAPIEELSRGGSDRGMRLVPYPLAGIEGPPIQRFDSLREAAEIYYTTRAEARRMDRTRAELNTGVRSRRSRLGRARDRVIEQVPSSDEAERLRQAADLLLAHPQAEIRDNTALLPNDYGDGETLRVRIDPALDRVANAQRLYRRAQRLKRTLARGTARRHELEASLAALARLQERVETMSSLHDRRQVLREAAGLGVVVRETRMREPETVTGVAAASMDSGVAATKAHSERSIPGVMRFHTSEGDEILVGRNARGNDRLTHEIAARDDFWLHALGPGSHVVLRNPTRLDDPPAKALRIASALAGWFSKARQASKVEIHWTRARHVKRPHKGAAGIALLDRYSSLLIAPASPADLGIEDG